MREAVESAWSVPRAFRCMSKNFGGRVAPAENKKKKQQKKTKPTNINPIMKEQKNNKMIHFTVRLHARYI